MQLTEIETFTGMFPCMPVRLRKPLSPTLNERLVRSYAEEAENHDRLALAARRGIVQPHPIAHGQVVIGAQIFEADFRSLARHFV